MRNLSGGGPPLFSAPDTLFPPPPLRRPVGRQDVTSSDSDATRSPIGRHQSLPNPAVQGESGHPQFRGDVCHAFEPCIEPVLLFCGLSQTFQHLPSSCFVILSHALLLSPVCLDS